jgi:hypothetical protein
MSPLIILRVAQQYLDSTTDHEAHDYNHAVAETEIVRYNNGPTVRKPASTWAWIRL